MARTYEFAVGSTEAGQRLDRYLVHRLPATVSRAMIQRSIQQGLVTVGGRAVKASYKLHRDDAVTARFEHLPAPARDLPLVPQDIPLQIVHEDGSLLVVNKPAGLVTHPAPGHWTGTLVNAILWHLQKGQGAGDRGRGKTGSPSPLAPRPSPPRAGIVHRLDKDTSGLLLIAKTEQAHVSLSRQLKARRIHRQYLALVEGHLPLDTGTVNAPIGRHLTHRKVMTIRHLGGRIAVTHYRVLKRTNLQELSLGAGGGRRGAGENKQQTIPSPLAPRPSPPPFRFTIVDVSLDTGRTHQIRVHMAHLGHPVMGDMTYGKHPAGFWQVMGVKRQLLHAYRLSFQHPATGAALTLSAPVPDDITAWLGSERSVMV